MEIVVRGRNTDVSTKFRDHVEERLERLEHHGSNLTRVDVEVTKAGNPRMADQAMRVELTCRGRGPVVRAEYATSDKYVAFDAAADRLQERLRRSAERRRARTRGGGRPDFPVPPLETPAVEQPAVEEAPSLESDVVYAEGPVLVREKTHATEAMTVEDALDAMESVGHDFYLFLDSANGKPSVVYRRRGYDYGLIRLEVAAAPVAS